MGNSKDIWAIERTSVWYIAASRNCLLPLPLLFPLLPLSLCLIFLSSYFLIYLSFTLSKFEQVLSPLRFKLYIYKYITCVVCFWIYKYGQMDEKVGVYVFLIWIFFFWGLIFLFCFWIYKCGQMDEMWYWMPSEILYSLFIWVLVFHGDCCVGPYF